MQVKVNNVEITLEEGSTVEDAIKIANAPYVDGTTIALIEGRQELEKHVNKYKIITTKGSIIIELVDGFDELTSIWKNSFTDFIDKEIRWSYYNRFRIQS